MELEELKNWLISTSTMDNGNLRTRTEERILKNNDIVEALKYFIPFETSSLCEKALYILSDKFEPKLCVCGKQIPFKKICCGPKCARLDSSISEKRKQTNIKKYGVDNASKSQEVKNKISEINKKSYEDNKEEILNKRKETCLERFGGISALSNQTQKDKFKETCIERYGVDNYFKLNTFIESHKINRKPMSSKKRDEVKKKRFKTEFNKGIYHYKNTVPLFTEDDYHLEIHEREYKCLKCEKTFFRYSSNVTRCIHCHPINKSIGEVDLLELMNQLQIKNIVIDSRSTIKPYELDLYLPDHKLAIEYNGLMYHSYGKSDKWSKLDNHDKEDKKYHLRKTEECNKQGIQLLHIFENEWLNPIKQNIWKSIIKSKLGLNETIGARKCELLIVPTIEKTEFLNENHLQGNCSSSINIGLYYHSLLVAILCLSKSRFNKKYEWEITRFCNKVGFNISGSFSKLLNYFRNNYTGSIITYADKRYSNGELYKNNRFTELKDSEPNYFYFSKDLVLYSRINFQKHKLKDKLEIFDENLSESENMFNNYFRRIWDCGNKVFELI